MNILSQVTSPWTQPALQNHNRQPQRFQNRVYVDRHKQPSCHSRKLHWTQRCNRCHKEGLFNALTIIHLDTSNLQGMMSPKDPIVQKQLLISDLLSIVFENYWIKGEIPVGWRQANIVPIFKSGGENPVNYQLVSLTLIPGKFVGQRIKQTQDSGRQPCWVGLMQLK